MTADSGTHTAVRQQQQASWNRSATTWRDRAGHNTDGGVITERLLALAGIAPGQRVLDLACGVGDPSLDIAEMVGPSGSVLGLDLSDGMLDGARSIAGKRGIDNVEFRQIERETELGVPEGAFDVATCRFGLMFMPRPELALAELRRALKPSGRIAVSSWGPPERCPFFSLLDEILGRHVSLPVVGPDTPDPLRLPSFEIVADLFDRAGLEVAATETVTVPLQIEASPAAFWDARIASTGPFGTRVRELPDALQSEVRADAIATLTAMFGEGPVSLGADALLTAGVARG